MRRISYRYQRTVAGPAQVQGIGFLTGALVHLRFCPAPPSTGIVFVRTDLPSRPSIPAQVSEVSGTNRRTTLGRGGVQVGLVEHVLAALSGLRIDNAFVELDAPEPPGLDGSARGFVDALHGAGARLQGARRPVYAVTEPMLVRSPGATLALHPPQDNELQISYLLDYGRGSPIDWQMHSVTLTPESFANEIADCRTFILEKEAEVLRRQGLGSRSTLADLLVFGPAGPIENRLRYANEPARHKILDLVGDLALFPGDLRGHVVAYRSGHPLNVTLARSVHEQLARRNTRPLRLAA